ncbi:hypothetical protein BGZ99_001345 [Dissophora globulifera]|uniref:Wbp11/ELF5/Saf1 N-terminal domain-containing protein n=1 Tax=Dissophora globulifera TaxID=979702 RepID=A0A9P6RPS6_9FUNG|nr:hypothetical protein BGZ99_001345 [Dissophora globulifera]
MGRKGGKSLNPADQYRKEQHKKEIKKNKQDRKKVREVNTALRDTTTESELVDYEELERTGKIDKHGAERLEELRGKMAKIIEIKKAHGIKIRPKKQEPEKPISVAEQARDPTRSIYYDPVLNPYGAPPPGQPYLEYPPLPSELPIGMEAAPGTIQQEQSREIEDDSDQESYDSDSESNSDSDSDSSSSGSDSEDIDNEDYMPPLPEGPAPSKEEQAKYLEPTKPRLPVAPRIQQQPWPPSQIRPGMYPPGMPHPGIQGPPGSPMNPYGPPMGAQPPYGNLYLPGRPMHGPPPIGHIPPPMQAGPGFGLPPPGYGQPGYGPPGYRPPDHGPSGYGPPGQGPPGGPGGFGPSGYQGRPMRPPSHRGPPARYIKPPRTADPQSDPMTGHLPPDEKEKKRVADQREAAVAAATEAAASSDGSTLTTPTQHPLPPRPTTTQVPAKPVATAGPVSISEEPQLRNLQKELVHLVPSSIMRKRVTQKGKIGKPVNAAPGVDVDDDRTTRATKYSTRVSAEEDEQEVEEDKEESQRETGLGLRLPRLNAAPSVASVASILGAPRKIVVNSAPEVVVDKAARKKAEYDDFMQGLAGDGLL